MMRVFLDTNILLDYLLKRDGFFDAALDIFKMAAKGKLVLLVSDLSFANIKYITRKAIPLEVFYDVMLKLKQFVTVVPIGDRAVEEALKVRAKDFEDSLQYFSALYANADVIVTRNIKDFDYPNMNIMDSQTFVDAFGKTK